MIKVLGVYKGVKNKPYGPFKGSDGREISGITNNCYVEDVEDLTVAPDERLVEIKLPTADYVPKLKIGDNVEIPCKLNRSGKLVLISDSVIKK